MNPSTLPSRFPYLLITSQFNVEQVLEKRAMAAGVRIVRGARVTALRQDADGVDFTVDGGTVQADDAVGLRSVVPRRSRLPFPGKSALESIMLADVRLAQPLQLASPPHMPA